MCSDKHIFSILMHYFYPYILLTYVFYVHWFLFIPFIQEKKCTKRPIQDIAEVFFSFHVSLLIHFSSNCV